MVSCLFVFLLSVEVVMFLSCFPAGGPSLFARFLSESDFKRSTRMTFRAALRSFAGWCDSHGVKDPGPGDVCRWKDFLIASYETATARTYLSAVKVFFRWLARQGLGRDAGASVRGIRVERAFRRDCLSGMEMRRMLALMEDGLADGDAVRLRDFVMVLLIVVCGLRVSEVSRLDEGDLDTEGGEPVLWVHGKGRDGKVDFVPVPTVLRQLVFGNLEKRRPLSRRSPMFVSYSRNGFGRRLSARSISRVVKQAMVAVGFDSPRLTAHSLRHTAVTLALKGGATLQQVQQYARHRQIETTLRYAHNLENARNPCPMLVMKLIGRLDGPQLPGS